jgi:hypothetical protein
MIIIQTQAQLYDNGARTLLVDHALEYFDYLIGQVGFLQKMFDSSAVDL